MACCEHARLNLRDLRARTQDIVDNEVVQTGNQRKFERLIRKPTEQIEQGTVQSSIGDGCPVRVYMQPSLCQMTLAAVAESTMTQSRTSSGIRKIETEDQFNIECHKLRGGIFDRHGTIVDMDTCGAIVPTIDHEDRDGWTQQVVDRNKKCFGAKSGHLGHLFESQMESERQIKELVNIEKLEVAEIMLQIIYAGWLDDVARRTPEDLTADRGSKDAIITASRIMWSMAATKVIEKEQHHSTSDGWRSATTYGVKRGTRIARMLEQEKWDRVFSATCVGVPGQLRPDQRNLVRPVVPEAEAEQGVAPVIVMLADPNTDRRRYVTKRDLVKYGYTDECQACTQLASGMHNAKVPHGDRCRDLIGELMAGDDDQRQIERMTSRTTIEVENEIPRPEAGEEVDVGEPKVRVAGQVEEQPIPTVRVGGSSGSGTRVQEQVKQTQMIVK